MGLRDFFDGQRQHAGGDDCHTGLGRVILTLGRLGKQAFCTLTKASICRCETSQVPIFFIREDHDSPALLFGNHASSDDQGLAAAKTNFPATVPFPCARSRFPVTPSSKRVPVLALVYMLNYASWMHR
jgi:hypothetical protein